MAVCTQLQGSLSLLNPWEGMGLVLTWLQIYSDSKQAMKLLPQFPSL